MRALRSSDADGRARYDAALTLYRALAIRANRETAETVDAAGGVRDGVDGRAVAADDDDTDDVDEHARGVRRETAVCAMGALARVRGDGEAAETLRGVGGRMVGAGVGEMDAGPRCVGTSSDEATRALSASDLVRFAAILSKSADSPASRAFCDCGGVSPLLADRRRRSGEVFDEFGSHVRRGEGRRGVLCVEFHAIRRRERDGGDRGDITIILGDDARLFAQCGGDDASETPPGGRWRNVRRRDGVETVRSSVNRRIIYPISRIVSP